MGRSPRCSEEGEGLNRGAWTAQEDRLLTSYILAHGEGKWTHVPKRAGLNRSGKSCRLRWLNYLKPDIKRGNITQDEEELIIRLHKLLGNRWSLIAGRLPGRTDNEIKNYWNTTLAKKLRTQSCAMSEQHPFSKSIASKPDVAQHQVIQTKASRCKNVVILDPPYPEEKSTVNSLALNQLEFDEAHLTTQFTNQSQGSYTPKAQVVDEYHNSDVNLFSPERNEFQVNAADFCKDFNLDGSVAMVMDAQADQVRSIDELANCWTTNNGFENDDTMDLDLMTFVMHSGDWS